MKIIIKRTQTLEIEPESEDWEEGTTPEQMLEQHLLDASDDDLDFSDAKTDITGEVVGVEETIIGFAG